MENGTNRPLVIKRQMLASVCTVFYSWITPFVAERWLFNKESNQVAFRRKEENVKFNLPETADGTGTRHFGKFPFLTAEQNLSFAISAPEHFSGESKITLTFRETGAGCEMDFVQENIDAGITEEAWTKMFARLEAVLQIPYRLTEESSVEDIVTSIEVVVMQIFGLAGGLTAEQLNQVPGPGIWTIGQILAHVDKYLHFIPETMQMQGQEVERDPTAMAVVFRQTFLDPTIKFKSPEMLVPENKLYEFGELFHSVSSRLELMRQRAMSVDLLVEIEGLPMGPVTKIELLLFTFYHSQRHLWQTRKLVDAL